MKGLGAYDNNRLDLTSPHYLDTFLLNSFEIIFKHIVEQFCASIFEISWQLNSCRGAAIAFSEAIGFRIYPVEGACRSQATCEHRKMHSFSGDRAAVILVT